VAGRDRSAVVQDVTAGDNDFTGTSGGRYPAGPGYDMATGLGSPRAAALAAALCAEGLRLAAPADRFSFRGRPAGLRLQVSDAAGAGLRLRVTGLPAGLRMSQTTGRISGRPRRIGRRRVTISATDGLGALRSVSFVWTIDGTPSISLGRGLAVRVRRGRLEPALSSVALTLPAGLSLASPRRVSVPGGRVSGRGRRVLVRLAPGSPALVWIGFGRGALRGRPAPGAPLGVTVVDAGRQRYVTSVAP
jgi:hypothetical protein